MQERSHHDGQPSFVGNLIHEDREKADLSLSQYAAIVGVSRTYLSRLEREIYTHPSPDILVEISKARGISLADLFLAAGYQVPSELPSLVPYLRAIHPTWPDDAIADCTRFCGYVEHEYGSGTTDA
jgi:transcriptional regulator with XRE-family HTH domain